MAENKKSKVNIDQESINAQIKECVNKIDLLEEIEQKINYREVLTEGIDTDGVVQEYRDKRNNMLQTYNKSRFSAKMQERMRYNSSRGYGAFKSFFSSLFSGKKIDREINLKEDDRIRQEITDKYNDKIKEQVQNIRGASNSKSGIQELKKELEFEVAKGKNKENNSYLSKLVKELERTLDTMKIRSGDAREDLNNLELAPTTKNLNKSKSKDDSDIDIRADIELA